MWLFLISYILCSLSLRVYDEGPLLTVGGNCGILNGVCVPGKSLYIPLLDLSKEMLTVTECAEIFYCSVICIWSASSFNIVKMHTLRWHTVGN